MLQLTQVVLIQDFKRLFQTNWCLGKWCDFATSRNIAGKLDYPKLLQSKQLCNNMYSIAGFGIGHALLLQHFATSTLLGRHQNEFYIRSIR